MLKLPNLPTFIFSMILFIISLAILKYAIATQSLVWGIVALIIGKIEITFAPREIFGERGDE